MKRLTFTSIALGLVFSAMGQDEMPVTWESRLDHKIQYYGTGTENRGHSYAASDKELTVFSNGSGEALWTKRYKDMTDKLRKIDALVPFWESGAIFLFDKKLGQDKLAVVNMKDGNVMWTSTQYQGLTDESIIYVPEKDGFILSLKKEIAFVKAKTGEEMWRSARFSGAIGKYIYSGSDNSITMVNFKPSGLAAFFSGYKNQIAKFDIDSGSLIWEANYTGRAEQKMNSRKLRNRREFLFDLDLIDDEKLVLRLNGMQVYDFKTGAQLWNASFDFTPDGKLTGNKRFMGNVNAWATYGAVADPLIVGNDVYIVDMSDKNKQYIRKYDRQSGKLLWTSDEIKKARAIPELYFIDGKVIAQIGGVCEQHTYKKESDSNGTTEHWGIQYENVKPNGLKAFDASSGSMAWESERFKKGITNGFVHNDKFIVSSGKELYSIDYKSGDVNYTVDAKNGGVGNAVQILSHGEDVVVIGEKGVSKFSINDGSLVCDGKWKKSSLMDRIGNILVMQNEKGDIACYNLDNICGFREFKGKKDASFSLSTKGDFVYAYEKKDVTKLAAR